MIDKHSERVPAMNEDEAAAIGAAQNAFDENLPTHLDYAILICGPSSTTCGVMTIGILSNLSNEAKTLKLIKRVLDKRRKEREAME